MMLTSWPAMRMFMALVWRNRCGNRRLPARDGWSSDAIFWYLSSRAWKPSRVSFRLVRPRAGNSGSAGGPLVCSRTALNNP